MLTPFPTPVLSLAPDAVKNLEGRDALSGLWTLFTKCKESLQDGRRLENISWRLWYREMMRAELLNRLHHDGEANEKEEQDRALIPQGLHTPVYLYRPPTPSESEPSPAYVVGDANGIYDSTVNCGPPLMSATTAVLSQDHDHATSSPTLSSSSLSPTQLTMLRSLYPVDPVPCAPLDSPSASLQMSKSKLNSHTALSPLVSAPSSSGSNSRDFPDVPPHVRALSLQSTQERGLVEFQAQITHYTGSNTGTPVSIGRIIYDMLPCSVFPSMTTSTSCTKECIPTPVVDPPSSLPYTSLHAAPPSPSLSDSYANAHPGEVQVSDTTPLDIGVGVGGGPSLSVSVSSPSSPQMLGNAHTFGLPPNLQLPPRLVIVNPTPNLTPHPTPPASPLSASASTPLASTSGIGSGSNSFGGTKGSWLTLPPSHHPYRQERHYDRSRSDSTTTAVDTSFLPPQPPQTPPCADEDHLLSSSQSFVQDLESSANSNSNRHSISSITTITSTTDSTTSTTISTATAATSTFLDEGSDVEEARKTMKEEDMWINDAPVIGSPVDAQPQGSGPSVRSRVHSLSTIHSMSVRKGGGEEDDLSAQDTGVEELDELGNGGSTRLLNAAATTVAAATKKKKKIVTKKIKTKTKPSKINSLMTLTAQLARQDTDAQGAEIRQQRRLHHEQQQGQGETNELPSSSKWPVAFRIGSNSDEGSGVGSNSKSGSEFFGVERPMVPVADTIVNGKGEERDDRDAVGILAEQSHEEDTARQVHHLGIMQQQHTVVHHHHRTPPHPAPLQQLKSEKHLGRQMAREGEPVRAGGQLRKEEKGKGREYSNHHTNSKLGRTSSKANPKHSTHETLNMVSSALAAKVENTLADPLLPGQHKRTIVLTTSGSEFEDSDDEGRWSSEEMGSEDEREGQRVESQDRLLAEQYQQQLQRQLQQQQLQQLQQIQQVQHRQQQLQRQLQQQQLQQVQQVQHRPPPLQRAHTTNHPPTANYIHHYYHTHAANRAQRTQSSRSHRHLPNQPQGQTLLEAAKEAQRQREMFVKKPVESFQNLAQIARTQSVGLLTQLLNPDPEIFPVGHPYRRRFSSTEIKGVDGGDRVGDIRSPQPPMNVTKTDNDKSDQPPLPLRPEAMRRKSSSPLGHPQTTGVLSPPTRTLSMQMSKSTAAMPVSSQVQVGSVNTHTSNAVEGGHGAVDGFGMMDTKMKVNGHHSGGYRPKGPPQDQELEDESGSDAEAVSGIQVSKSVAQEKLKALAERRGIVAHGNQPAMTSNDGAANGRPKTQLGDEDDVPDWAKVSQSRPPNRTRSHDQYTQSQVPDHHPNRRSLNAFHFSHTAASTANRPTPIPVGHPYNLPPPAPPSTPRTTRRLMLSTELSESLRRNLLWERQLSKVNLAAAVRRTASSGGSRHSFLGGVQPLTTAPSMVKLLPKGTLTHPNPGSPALPEHRVGGGGGGVKERRASGGAGDVPGPSVDDEEEREKRRRLAMARNRSWANDYHCAGW